MTGFFGAGTVVAVFLTGPLVQFWLPKTKKAVQKVLKEQVKTKRKGEDYE